MIENDSIIDSSALFSGRKTKRASMTLLSIETQKYRRAEGKALCPAALRLLHEISVLFRYVRCTGPLPSPRRYPG